MARNPADDRTVIAVVVGIQLTAALGFYAAMAHVALHLENLRLAAGTIGVVLATRVLVQQVLFLPGGAMVDRIGGGRAGVAACLLRAGGFSLLAVAGTVPSLLASGVALGLGGALFHPAAHALIAGTSDGVRVRGYAAYTAAGQIAAVAGPLIALAVVGDSVGVGAYPGLAAAAAAAWSIGALLFMRLWFRRGPVEITTEPLSDGIRAALRDRTFLVFVVATCSAPLLAEQAYVAVVLWTEDPTASTVFLCLAAASAALVQPWCARGERSARVSVLQLGFVLNGGAYAILVIAGGVQWPLLALSGVLHGLGSGMLLAAIFRQLLRFAPAGRFGVYYGARACAGGIVAFTGGALIGTSFESGTRGAMAAMLGLAAVAGAAALLCGVRALGVNKVPRPDPPGETA